ncbi:MAG: hypothetical protein QNK23_05760 [Crocinitomicaceae bacterium]|nr:hypothetical protein [Crocinitomicaceae bacterium]
MKLLLLICSAIILVVGLSCINSTDENINAITDRDNFRFEIGLQKLNQVKPIDEEQIHGNWTMITSLFTITFGDGRHGNTTFGLEGRKYNIDRDGGLWDTNSWSLTENSTQINLIYDGEVFDHYKVRVKQDTMEWIEQLDDGELMYFVLVKD